MNAIDISHWQGGLNLSALFSQNPDLGAVIVKATGGVGYVDPNCDSWVQWLRANNVPWGFYHFMDDDFRHSSGTKEADFFVAKTENYFGEGIPIADYEYPANYKGTAYLKEFLDRVTELTGVKPMVYCSLSVVQSQDFSRIAAAGYTLWLAQYADNNVVNGFQAHPWQQGSFAPFDRITMHQYTSHGRLKGWSGNLDFDIFYGDRADWDRLAGVNPGPEPEPLKPADPEVVNAVLRGEYGNGSARAGNLERAGYDSEDVQNKVNELYAVALSCHNYTRGNEDYLNSILYILRNL